MLESLKEYLILLLGLLIAWLGFRWRKQSRTSPKIIRDELSKSDYKGLVDFVICQSKHETGNFKSFLAKEKNALFGMGVPIYRKSYRVGEYTANNGEVFSVYSSKEDSVRDYIEWLKYTRFPTKVDSIEDFAEEIQNRNYATAPDYEKKLIKICY